MSKNITDIKKKIIKIMKITITIILLFSGISLAKVFYTTNIETKAEIANPILEIENDPTINITKNEGKGIYNFKVKNYDETGKITQIDLEYYIELISNTNKKIYFKIYKNDEELNIDGNRTQYFSIQKQKKQNDNYRVEILIEKSSLEEEIKKEVKIKIYTKQKEK